jgi:hypothetical protein
MFSCLANHFLELCPRGYGSCAQDLWGIPKNPGEWDRDEVRPLLVHVHRDVMDPLDHA